jgi:hypothetical protein
MLEASFCGGVVDISTRYLGVTFASPVREMLTH